MLARTRCASTRLTKTACALRPRAIALLGQGLSVSAMTTSACTATGNHPGLWEIPELMCATSALIVTGTSAVLQEGGLTANILCGIRWPAPQACHRQNHR